MHSIVYLLVSYKHRVEVPFSSGCLLLGVIGVVVELLAEGMGRSGRQDGCRSKTKHGIAPGNHVERRCRRSFALGGRKGSCTAHEASKEREETHCLSCRRSVLRKNAINAL